MNAAMTAVKYEGCEEGTDAEREVADYKNALHSASKN